MVLINFLLILFKIKKSITHLQALLGRNKKTWVRSKYLYSYPIQRKSFLEENKKLSRIIILSLRVEIFSNCKVYIVFIILMSAVIMGIGHQVKAAGDQNKQKLLNEKHTVKPFTLKLLM